MFLMLKDHTMVNLDKIEHISIEKTIDGEYSVNGVMNNSSLVFILFTPKNNDEESCIEFMKDLEYKINYSNNYISRRPTIYNKKNVN